jgi:hypothetical protein
MTTAATPPTPPPEHQQRVAELEVIRRIEAEGGPVGDERDRRRDRRAAEPPVSERPDPHFCNDDCCCAMALEAGDAEPPVPDELYNRLRRFLLEQASVLPTMLPVDAQATVVHLAIDATEQIENGFKMLVELVGDLAFERGWASHAMFAGRLAAAATAEPTADERLVVVDGGRA